MTELVELVRVNTADGIRLDGAWQTASTPQRESLAASPRACDAVLLVHGTGANFYASSLLQYLAQQFQRQGISSLLVNTRGHDIIYTASTSAGPQRMGAAFERVADCVHDLAAWLGFLQSRGCQRIGVVGHSLGAIKAAYTFAGQPPENVAWLCAISPARLCYRHFLNGPHGQEFQSTLAEAESFVQAGRPDTLMQVRFPIPYTVTAAGYLDKYGPAEQYNVVVHAQRLTLPSLFTFGSVEVQQHAAFQKLPEDIQALHNPHLQVAVVAGADHVYSGARSELNACLDRWLRKL